MASDLTFFAPAYDFVDERLTTVLDDGLAGVLAEVVGPLRVALVLYIVLYGFAILRGAIAEPVMDFAVRSMKLVFIYTIATTPAYATYVTTPLFIELPSTLASAISGGAAVTAGEAFDELINYAGYLADKVSQEGTAFDPAPWIVAGTVFVIGAAASALGFGVVLVAKIALALLVALGPIFIGCALFEATRRYFFGWLSQGVNFLVLFALILTLVQLVLDLVRSQWGSIDGLDPVGGGLIFIALCVLGAFFFLQMPVLAAGIAGGASAGIADFGRAMTTGHGGGLDRGAVRTARAPPVSSGHQTR